MINQQRLWNNLAELAQIREADVPPIGTTRRAFTPAYITGRQWLATRFAAVGLQVFIDAGGNLIGRLPGSDDALPPIMIGSHSDTVMGGGSYDGALGVLGALEVAQTLIDHGISLRHPLEVVDFMAEESTPLGSLLGSTAMAAGLDHDVLMRDVPGWGTLADALRRVGGNPDAVAQPLRRPGEIAAYVEIHIEQGPRLERADIVLGAVTGIVGIRRADITCYGQPDHAGTASMDVRRDALAAVAQLIVAAEQAANRRTGAVATVGALEVLPNQSNVIPGQVRFTVEMRSLDMVEVESMWHEIHDTFVAACAARGVTFAIHALHDSQPVVFGESMISTIESACNAAVGTSMRLPSGAGHDGSMIGLIAPAGMIFVRTKNGRSHCPEEFSAPDDNAASVRALLDTVRALDTMVD
ncbi:MAG: Zn-dependent hydrolase [Chloroflexota bacterium]|jgi:N-carbamoyl-L-amino-acid hydrolase